MEDKLAIEQYSEYLFNHKFFDNDNFYRDIDRAICSGKDADEKIKEILKQRRKKFSYEDLKAEGMKATLEEFRNRHREKLLKNKEIKEDQGELKQLKDNIEAEKLKIEELVKLREENEKELMSYKKTLNTLLRCEYCCANIDEKIKAFRETIQAKFNKHDRENKEMKIKLLELVCNKINLCKKMNVYEKIPKQRRFEEECKKFLGSSRTLPQLKKLLTACFDFGESKVNSHMRQIYLPSSYGGIFPSYIHVDKDGDLDFSGGKSIFNLLEDADCIENIFSLKFK